MTQAFPGWDRDRDAGSGEGILAGVAAGEAASPVSQTYAIRLVEIGKHGIEVAVPIQITERHVEAPKRVRVDIDTGQGAALFRQANAIGLTGIGEDRVGFTVAVYIPDGNAKTVQ